MISAKEKDKVGKRSKKFQAFGDELYFIKGQSGKALLRSWHLCKDV